MMTGLDNRYIFNLDEKYLPGSIGNKAKQLRRLRDKRFPIPNTYVCTWDAHSNFMQGEPDLLPKLLDELKALIDANLNYAVRSSANLEDGLDSSFAGQFSSVLYVQGIENILQSIVEIWDRTNSEAVQSYMSKMFGGGVELKMGVIIQDMVTPVFSGVAFSRNPVTASDEIVIEAVEGPGTALVQGGVTPLRWVYKWGNWLAKPDNGRVSIEFIHQIVDQTQKISKVFRQDVDLEWVSDGTNLYWIQLRDITSLRETKIYSNRISKGMFPGLIKPLVYTTIAPILSRQWVRLISEIIGKNEIDPTQLVRIFHYHSYFDMGTFGNIFERLGLPRQSLEMMAGLLPEGSVKTSFKPQLKIVKLLPQTFGFLLDKWNFAARFERERPHLERALYVFPTNNLMQLDEYELDTSIKGIITVCDQIAYYTIVIQLLMFLYNAILKAQLSKRGVDFQNLDLMEGMDVLREYDPHADLESLNEWYRALNEDLQGKIIASNYQGLQEIPDLEDFRQKFENFLRKFGHLSDNNSDISCARWREIPDHILSMVVNYHQVKVQAIDKVQFGDIPTSGVNRWVLKLIYDRARQFRLYREISGSLLAYGFGLLRTYYLHLGKRLTQYNRLQHEEDIFYLYDREIKALPEERDNVEYTARLVTERKKEMKSCQDIILPEIIYGDQVPPILTAVTTKLSGVATSGGYYQGIVKVVRGIEDFPKLQEGDVLVVPFSDIGWTPLFAKAGAVISESGGMLCHASIIAREYNIPAVVSVTGAMQLKDNSLVCIDGYKGEVVIQ